MNIDQGIKRDRVVTIDRRDHRQRADELEAETQALRAEVRRLREKVLLVGTRQMMRAAVR